jgi:hypothetical protein
MEPTVFESHKQTHMTSSTLKNEAVRSSPESSCPTGTAHRILSTQKPLWTSSPHRLIQGTAHHNITLYSIHGLALIQAPRINPTRILCMLYSDDTAVNKVTNTSALCEGNFYLITRKMME